MEMLETIAKDYQCKYEKVSYVHKQKLAQLDPNSELVSVSVSRNIPLGELIDSVLEFRLPTDKPEQYKAFTLYAVESTAASWKLTLISKPDFNQLVPQSQKIYLENA